jgi:hypothetical protein
VYLAGQFGRYGVIVRDDDDRRAGVAKLVQQLEHGSP